VLTVTLADLRMRARQFAIAVVGATLVFAMALVMAGLAGGFRAEAGRTVDAVGADSFVVRAGGGGPFTSPADLNRRALAVVRRAPGVLAADPLVVQPSETLRTHEGQVFGHMIGTRPGGLGSPAPSEGRPLRHRGDAVVDVLTRLRVGEAFTIGAQHFTVVGRVSGMTYLAGTPSVYVTLADAQEVAFAGRHDMTSIAVRGIARAQLPPGLTVMTPDEARNDILTPLTNGIKSIDVVRDFLWCVAIVIIGAVVYLSALERRRDFAVLKAIGSSTRWLYSGLAIQASVMAVLSGALAIVIEPLLARMIPMQLAVSSSALAVLPVVALVIGLLASLSGLRQVARADPALAFGSA
jgi:putative ABC transport system permease protein